MRSSFWGAAAAASCLLHCASEGAPDSNPGDSAGPTATQPGDEGASPALPRSKPGASPPTSPDPVGTSPSTANPSELGPVPNGGVIAPPELGGTPTTGASCSGTTLSTGNHEDTLEHDGQTREYLVHVPASYTGTTQVPLVIDLHGLTSSAQAQANLSGWRAKADEAGFIVVHPQGLDNSWNGGALCCGSSLSAGVDDEGFMRAIVAKLESEACIDPQRVYATGLSNGGAMAHLLACNAADIFAATAPVSMGNGTRPCAPIRPISVVMTRGTQDPLVAYEGGLFPSAEADFTQWSELDGCSGDTTSEGLCETHSGCAGGTEVTLCSIDAGHVLYANTDNFSVPDQVWKTFERQRLP